MQWSRYIPAVDAFGPFLLQLVTSQLADISTTTCHTPAKAIADSANCSATRDQLPRENMSDPRGKKQSQGGIQEFDLCIRV